MQDHKFLLQHGQKKASICIIFIFALACCRKEMHSFGCLFTNIVEGHLIS